MSIRKETKMVSETVLKKLDTTQQQLIFNVLMDNFIDAWEIKNDKLFRRAFWIAAPEEGNGYVDLIQDFNSIAGLAYTNCQNLTACGFTCDDNGELVPADARAAKWAKANKKVYAGLVTRCCKVLRSATFIDPATIGIEAEIEGYRDWYYKSGFEGSGIPAMVDTYMDNNTTSDGGIENLPSTKSEEESGK